SPAVAHGVVYVTSDKLYALAAAGCGQATCQPLWSANAGYEEGGLYTNTAPVVVGNTVFVAGVNKKLYAFAAGGCGQATCTPVWTGTTGLGSGTPTAANGLIYVPASDDRSVYVFSTAGCGQSVCTPLWAGIVGSSILSNPSTANGLVYIVT